MDGFESFDWDALLRKMAKGLETSDASAPRNQGLIAAGAQMLMNSGRGLAPALGAGGMGFMEASNAERQRQTKDPMQLIGLANAVQQLKTGQQTQQELQRVQAMIGGGQSVPPQFTPAQGLPQDIQKQAYGMFDRGTGEGGTLGAMGQPQGGKLTPQQVQSLIGSTVPQISAMGEKLAKVYGYEPQNMRPGGSIVMPDAQGNPTVTYTAPNIGEGQQMNPDGTSSLVQGYLQNLRQIQQEMAAGKRAGELPYEAPVPVPTGVPGETKLLSKAGAIDVGNRNAQGSNAQPPSDVLAAMQFMSKQGVPVRWDAKTGLQFGDAAKNYQAERMGVNPGPVAEKIAEQRGAMPGKVEETALTDLAKGDAAKHDAAYTAAQSASNGNRTLQNIRENVNKDPGLYSGMFAEGKLGVAGFFNGLGLPFDEARFSNTQESKKYMDELGLSLIKSFVGSTNISDQDRKAVMSIMPRVTDSPKARDELLNTLQRINNEKIDQFGKMDAYIRENKTLRGFDYGFNRANDTKEAPRANEAPPMAGAKKAPDGNWYVKSGTRYYKVQQ